MRLTVDSPVTILRFIKETKLRLDPRFAGELSRYYESAGLRSNYFDKAAGLTIDELGEALVDRGLITVSETESGPTERETLELLDTLFTAVTRKPSQRTAESEVNAAGRAIEAELAKARNNRYRAWQCSCGLSLIRSARLMLRLRCEDCDSRLLRTERTVAEIKLGITLETIQRPDYRPVTDSDTVPF